MDHRLAVLLMLLSCGNNRALRVDPDTYVYFLYDIQEYFKSSSVFVLYDDSDNPSDHLDMATETNLGQLIRAFSARGTSSQAIGYSELRNDSASRARNEQTLFVAILSSAANLRHFSAATCVHGDMSYHPWLVVFVDAKVNATCHSPTGNPFNLAYNSRFAVTCHGDERVWKWYSVARNRTEVMPLARWTRATGISYGTKNYYQTRYDLKGESIRIAKHTDITSAQNGMMTGYLDEILDELRAFMNFRVTPVVKDDAFGSWNSRTQSWSGLIGSLVEDRTDLVVAPITLSAFRVGHIDFTLPLLLSANRIFFRQPEGAIVQWSAYFKAYTLVCWLLIALMLIAASMWIMMMRVIMKRPKGAGINYVAENFMSIWGIYCQQGVTDEFPSSTSLRIAYVTTLLLALILWAVYSASITSYLTSLAPGLPFSDTEGFVKDGTYRLIVLQNSSDYHTIMSGQDPVLTKLQPFLKNPADLPSNPFSGFLQVCNESVGFYANDAVLRGVSDRLPCEFTYIETGQFECLAMALQKRSPYTTTINHNLRKLEDSGVIKKLHRWYFQELDNTKLDAGPTSIGLWAVAPLLSILAAGFALSIFVLLMERLCFDTYDYERKAGADWQRSMRVKRRF